MYTERKKERKMNIEMISSVCSNNYQLEETKTQNHQSNSELGINILN